MYNDEEIWDEAILIVRDRLCENCTLQRKTLDLYCDETCDYFDMAAKEIYNIILHDKAQNIYGMPGVKHETQTAK